MILWAMSYITLVGCLILCVKIKISSKNPCSVDDKKKVTKVEKLQIKAQGDGCTIDISGSHLGIKQEDQNGLSRFAVKPATKRINIEELVKKYRDRTSMRKNNNPEYDV
ncbi:unnamed protein product [Moneuplotes crassus]|uniref:Uncharacterized protein n=1 Tax=Euplotes crassus TaxID=5936 RepID=A0AAD1UQA2_EUPCR|nr:unnamed protein product [Moneuplotes crassus]